MIECENHLRAGLRRDPFSPGLANWLASELKDVGRTNEALQLATSSLAHDPYDPDYTGMALRMSEAAGMHAEADDLYRNAVRGWPDNDAIFWDRVYGILDSGDFALLEEFQKELSSANRLRALEPAMPVIAALKANDVAGVRRLCPPTAAPGFKTDVCMLSLARIGDKDNAFTLAWRIYPNRIGRTLAEEDKLWLEGGRFFDSDILMGPAAAPLREDRRYLELARRLGALAYWRSGRLPDFCAQPRPEGICRSFTSSAGTASARR
jgi:tetratricopeptide (TPR) repeat protein